MNSRDAEIARLRADVATWQARALDAVREGNAAVEAERKRHAATRLRIALFAGTVERAAFEHRRKPGGMSVPFFGDFAHVPPSTIARLEWWARNLMDVATDPHATPENVCALEPKALAESLRRSAEDIEVRHGLRSEETPETARAQERADVCAALTSEADAHRPHDPDVSMAFVMVRRKIERGAHVGASGGAS